jgi:maltoporin
MYLLNTWPLDNINAIGGGLDYHHDLFELRSVAAFARPDDPFQRQVIDVAPEGGRFTPDEVFILDRPRLVLGLKGTYFPFGTTNDFGAKAVLYGEYHSIGDGQRQLTDGTIEQLPADDGMMVGAQLGGWLVEGHAFANLFFRYARGLAAYNPLGVPFSSTTTVVTTERAEETMLALSANYEYDFVGVQVAAYYRRFRDADPSLLERNLLAEGAIDVRPYIWFTDWLGVAVDGSYQGLQETGLDETTGQPIGGNVWKLGIIPFISPSGRGTYTRPHFRIIYSATYRDEGARRLYNSADPRAAHEVEHFLGIGAEWWIDTSSYLGPQLR